MRERLTANCLAQQASWEQQSQYVQRRDGGGCTRIRSQNQVEAMASQPAGKSLVARFWSGQGRQEKNRPGVSYIVEEAGRHTYRIIHIHKFAGRKTLPGVHLGKRSVDAGAGPATARQGQSRPGQGRPGKSSRLTARGNYKLLKIISLKM